MGWRGGIASGRTSRTVLPAATEMPTLVAADIETAGRDGDEAGAGDDRRDRRGQHVVGAPQPHPDQDQLRPFARHGAQPLDGAPGLGTQRQDVADQVVGGLAGGGQVPVDELALEDDGVPVVGEAGAAEVGPLQDGHVDRQRLVVAREPEHEIALDRTAEALVEAPDVLDHVAPQERGREVDRASTEQLEPVATHGAGAGQDGRGARAVGVGEELAEHLRQPLAAQGEERDVVGRAVLECGVERTCVPAAGLADERDAVVEGGHPLQDRRRVVQRAAVHRDEVPVGEGLRLQRGDGRVHERAGVLGGHDHGDRGGGAQGGREAGGRTRPAPGRSSTTSSRHAAADSIAAAR